MSNEGLEVQGVCVLSLIPFQESIFAPSAGHFLFDFADGTDGPKRLVPLQFQNSCDLTWISDQTSLQFKKFPCSRGNAS